MTFHKVVLLFLSLFCHDENIYNNWGAINIYKILGRETTKERKQGKRNRYNDFQLCQGPRGAIDEEGGRWETDEHQSIHGRAKPMEDPRGGGV